MIIQNMLRENTGTHFLDSGGEGGRAWQRNQGRDFEKEPGSTLEIDFDRGDVIISKSTYHYLTEFFEATPESERLTHDLLKFADEPENKDCGWLQAMEMYFERRLQPVIQHEGWKSYNVSDKGNVTNTYNYESTIDQVLQFMLFPWKNDIPYIMLQIHGGADVRGGYTAPHIFAFKAREHDIDEFYIQDGDYNVNVGEEQWYTDDHGYHWYFEGSSQRSLDQKGFVDHIREFLKKEDVDVENSMTFPGDLYGCSIAGAVILSPMDDMREVEDPGYFEGPLDGEAGRKQSKILKILAVYDSGEKFADRYSIYVDEKHDREGKYYMVLGLSDNCNMPNGYNMWGNGQLGSHNGKKITFDQLPPQVQKCAQVRLGI